MTEQTLREMSLEDLKAYAETFGVFDDGDRESLIRRTCEKAGIFYIDPERGKARYPFPYQLGLTDTTDTDKNTKYVMNYIRSLAEEGVEYVYIDLPHGSLLLAMAVNGMLREIFDGAEPTLLGAMIAARFGRSKLTDMMISWVPGIGKADRKINFSDDAPSIPLQLARQFYEQGNKDEWDIFVRTAAEYFIVEGAKVSQKSHTKGGQNV